jgi:gliding motility-associated-like protein
MIKNLLTVLLIAISSFIYGQCVTNVNFNGWQVAGQPANGNWSLQNGGTQVYQSVNGAPAFFISPFDLMNVRVTGRFRSNDLDDDWMGFVFSFLNPLSAIDTFDCWLYDWKQDNQGAAPQGMSLCRIDGVIPPGAYGTTFNNHQNTPEFTVVQNTFGGPGWSTFTNHDFELELTYTRARIFIDGALIFDRQDCFKPGRFGFYNYSQSDCIYSNFQYELFTNFALSSNKICVGESVEYQFINPCVTTLSQYQSLTWNFGDGTVVANNNPTLANVNAFHTYTTPGTYTASMTVVDNNGCTHTSSNTVEVRAPITLTSTNVPPPCNGGSNGSITVNATGGYGNYTYSWNGGVNTQQTFNGVSAGTYVVSVTDGFCNATGQYTVNQPTALTAVTSSTAASCGANNGTATITISGGTPPYQGVNWVGIPGNTVTGLAGGFYIADFTDANGCSALLQYSTTVLSLPCGINTSSTTTNVSCFGGNNGTATVTVTGATPPPGNITWSNGATGFTASNLSAGTYGYTFTDGVPSNSFSGTVVINAPPVAMVASLATTGISCAGINDGQAIASVVSGGNPPYNYAWSGGQPNNPVAGNLSPGVVTVTITDANGCTATATGTVSSTPSINLTTTTVMDSCYNSGKGVATVSVTGGNPPFIYEWNNFLTNDTIVNLIQGTYTVTVTDDKNCTALANAVVTGITNPITYTYTKQNINCNGQATGSFNVSPTGGTPGYVFNWGQPGVSGSNPTGLAAGIYTYTITDNFGCVKIGGDTLRQPDTALYAFTTSTDVTCFNANNGTIQLTVGGGKPPYTYLGNPVPTGGITLTGLSAGIYTATIVDSNLCSISISDTILAPAAQSLTLTGVNNPCFGASLGSAAANFVNSTGTVTYNWTGGLTGTTISNLAPGTYSVTATDQNNCVLSDSVTISAPAIVALNVAITNAPCFGTNGSATANPVGGTAPFNYSWSNAGTTATISAPAGSYNVTATDASNCIQTGSGTISEPGGISFTSTQTGNNCFGDTNGSITLTVSGGSGPNYTYAWLPNVSSTNSATNLATGQYTITITDQLNCSTDTVIDIAGPSAALSATAVGTNVSCFGLTDGNVSISAIGGTPTYTYAWSPNVSTTAVAANLGQGTYDATVTDFNGCTATASASIIEPTAITFTTAQTDLSCFQSNDGAASVTVSGGVSPYTYTWTPNVSTTDNATSLASGNYNVVIADNSNCTVTTSFTLTQPTAIVLTETQVNNLCSGNANGSIDITVTGGSPAYTYTWSPNVSTTNTATGLTSGTYVVTVFDNINCSTSISVTITEPAPIAITPAATNLLCFGDNSGTLTISATGGTNPLSYAISPDGITFSTSANGVFTGLAAGTYTIIVADVNLCADTTSAIITEPTQIIATSAATPASCFNTVDGSALISAVGGSPTYTFNVAGLGQNTTGQFNSLAAGNYAVTITDANACSTNSSFTITQPDSVVITISPDPTEVDLGETITLQSTTNQGGVLTYNWQPTNGLSCTDCAAPEFTGIYSGIYILTISNDAGCSGTQTVTVTVVPNYDLFVPNAFSPNGDGQNDFWQVYGKLTNIKQLEVNVFNRWGEKVFESTDANFQWDGNFKGQTVPPAVYVWQLNVVFIDNHTEELRAGSLTVIK